MIQLPLITAMLLLATPTLDGPDTPAMIFVLALAGLAPALLRRPD